MRHIAEAAESWIAPIAARALAAGLGERIGHELHAMLAAHRASPSGNVWRNRAGGQPGFVFNPSAYLDEAGGFDFAALGHDVQLAVTALTLAAPPSTGCGWVLPISICSWRGWGWLTTRRRRGIWR
ncbi:hypothetical protein GT370_11840 [Acidocella sp. MX-AZ03]|uniref:hypothetical protein n=1 Tax=Acidocella sp. MX-AZ03 TaxID=2697363 RepID=UPI0022DE63D3|nr:hypothetical protein [Acidocella sp. MX-AZ03]WBO57968.1 hypothetical protein GT370_11840 [Acidocella sp. MX-AZ03]